MQLVLKTKANYLPIKLCWVKKNTFGFISENTTGRLTPRLTPPEDLNPEQRRCETLKCQTVVSTFFGRDKQRREKDQQIPHSKLYSLYLLLELWVGMKPVSHTDRPWGVAESQQSIPLSDYISQKIGSKVTDKS